MQYAWLLLLFFPLTAKPQTTLMLTDTFDLLFQSYFDPAEPGGAVLIVKDNEIVYQKGFGLADVNSKELITTKTLFNIGSISKTFVAYGILKLAAENKLSIEDNLYKYFPDFTNAAMAQEVKLYHLLTHSSGIPDNRRVKEQHDFYLSAKDNENFTPLKQTDALKFDPGTKYEYSNPAFNGLALIIEKITGRKWQDYIQEIIFHPAGMKTSTITNGPHPESGVSHGYVKNKKGIFEELDYGEEPTFAAAGNGGVWSSVEELWKYEQAIQQYLFLDSNWVGKSRIAYPFPDWKDTMPSRLGLSWFLTKEMSYNITGHTGSQGGFISDYCWIPEKKIFYVFLCNIPKPIKEIRSKFFLTLQDNDWLDN